MHRLLALVVALMLFAGGAWADGNEPADSASAVQLAPGPNQTVAALVRLKDKRVFSVYLPRGSQSAIERARQASKVLERTLEEAPDAEVTIVDEGPTSIVYAGNTPVIQLGPDDALAAGDASVYVHAASIASAVRSALRTERMRQLVASRVFSVSLVVFAGLLMFLAVRRAGRATRSLGEWLDRHEHHVRGIEVGGVEVVGRGVARTAIARAVAIGLRVLQALLVYAWIAFSLSLFDATRDTGARITDSVLGPVVDFAQRAVSTLPVLVLLAIGVAVVIGIMRALRLFFESVERGEAWVSWLPRDLARPTGAITRLSVVVLAVAFAAPLASGAANGTLGRMGIAALVAVALATVPVLAAACVGSFTVFGRHVKVGDEIELGRYRGRVQNIGLLDIVIVEAHGGEVRVPHMLALVRPLRVTGHGAGSVARTHVDVGVDASASASRVRDVLLGVARERDPKAHVELVRFDALGAHFRVVGAFAPESGDVAIAAFEALREAGIPLGRIPARASESVNP